MIRQLLTEILNAGKIRTEKDFRIFWLLNDRIKDKSPYDLDYTEDFTPSMTIELKEGIATILVERIPEAELTPNHSCPYKHKENTPILFYNYDGLYYDSYKELQNAYINKQLEYYRTQLEGIEMTIGDLDDLCRNKTDWDSGKNYTHFMDEGKILVEEFPVGDGCKAIYTDIEPLTGYEVVSDATEAEYFKDFPVRINFLYTEQIW